MKKPTYILFSFLINLSCFGQTDTIINGQEFHFISKYENGQIKELGNFNKKTKQGYWVLYSNDGNLIEKGNYIKGKKSGIWKELNSESNCYWIGSYQKGVKEGTWFDKCQGYYMFRKGKKSKLYVDY